LLVEVTGVDQQQPELFIADIACFLLDDLALSRAELVGFEQDRRQAVVGCAILSVSQLALSKIDLDGLARPLDNQAAGLARQVIKFRSCVMVKSRRLPLSAMSIDPDPFISRIRCRDYNTRQWLAK